MKRTHEFQDPIHNFIRADNRERKLIDSAAFQRLRHIHQLATTYLVYPGATHKRFEHSLGVMDLAGRVFDTITDAENIRFPSVEAILPDRSELPSWRRIIRMAALCHDLGHLPFSHAAEKELLPTGQNHESLTVALIYSSELRAIWDDGLLISPEHVAKLSVGKKRLPTATFTPWEEILSEIIIGDAFGVDRIDYLLRDSYHLGVSYGKFDHHRLINTLRILPKSAGDDGPAEPALGVELGGLRAAESLLMARYYMYEQVYIHPTRRIYDIHLKEFMLDHFGSNMYPTEPERHLLITDNEMFSAMAAASRDSSLPGHAAACRITGRTHFKKVYQGNPDDKDRDIAAAKLIAEGLKAEFGADLVRYDEYKPTSIPSDFPVIVDVDRIVSSFSVSENIKRMPTTSAEFIFTNREIATDARRWIAANRDKVLEEAIQ